MGEVQEEPGLSSPGVVPGRVTWVLVIGVSGPGQGPGVLDPVCAAQTCSKIPWKIQGEGSQLWVFHTCLGTHRCSCSGSFRNAETRGAVGNHFTKTC